MKQETGKTGLRSAWRRTSFVAVAALTTPTLRPAAAAFDRPRTPRSASVSVAWTVRSR